MNIRPCEGVRSATNPDRPAAICRNCLRRIAHQRGERDRELIPAAYMRGVRMACNNKP